MTEPTSEKPETPQDGIRQAPQTISGILKELGPGLIVAGSIVGSGELIATTVTGAKAGFWLLWLIIIGCVIKVFVQVEIGRYSIVTGNTAMDGFVDVPGPRTRRHGNWLFWYWFIMFVVSIGQLGGIVGGVGQALSISYPITSYGKQFNALAEARTRLIVETRRLDKQIRLGDLEDEQTPIDSFADRTILPLLQLQADTLEDVADDARSLINEIKADRRLGIYLATLHFHLLELDASKARLVGLEPGSTAHSDAHAAVEQLEKEIDQQHARFASSHRLAEKFNRLQQKQNQMPDPGDDEIWGAVVTVFTVIILVVGRFTLIQNFSTALVAMFTLVTIVNLVLLQSNPDWGFSLGDLVDGLSFRLPPDSDQGLTIALMAFGIIGVGANELVMYPYWCQEKGYGRFVGPNDGSEEWTRRAQGWMRVMRWDAWCSMIVYTFATVAFYLLGASILWRTGLTPSGNDTIRYLAVMYEPVFGTTAQLVFLIGAFAVLYSTFFVANAAHARTFSDALRVIGLSRKENYRKLVVFFSAFFPTCCIVIYLVYPNPVKLVLYSGLMQALMLPMLAGAALFYRYRRVPAAMQPGRVWDIFLWMSGIGMLIAGLWLAWSKLFG